MTDDKLDLEEMERHLGALLPEDPPPGQRDYIEALRLAIARIRELEKQRDQLQEANTVEIERRRKAVKKVEALRAAISAECPLHHLPLENGWAHRHMRRGLRAISKCRLSADVLRALENHLTAAPEKEVK